MFSRFRSIAVCSTLCSLALLIAGCSSAPDGPPLAPVSGTITLNGAPLEGAIVTFTPQKGRASYGSTDDDGYYELTYAPGSPGAVIGTCKVSVSTQQEASGGEGGDPVIEARPEMVPLGYRNGSIVVEVEGGGSTHDFAITGDVEPPAGSESPDDSGGV